MRHRARLQATLGAIAWLSLASPQLGCGGPGGIHARLAYSEAGGVRVVDVPPGSPAELAGLRAGDRIVSIEGTRVTTLSYKEVVEQLRGRAGSTVAIEVAREGELVTLEIEREPYADR